MADPIIKIGSTGEAVKKAQQALYCRRYLVDLSEVDGVFGPVTRNRVIRYQLDRSVGEFFAFSFPLAVDGIVGPMTWSRLTPPLIKKGSKGNPVFLVQEILKSWGYPDYDPGPSTGLRQADRNRGQERPGHPHRLRQRPAEGRRHCRPEDVAGALQLSDCGHDAGARRQRPGPGGPANACAIAQPLLCVGAHGRDVQRRPRPPLGDQHAEVLRRPRDALRGILGPPRPGRAVGRAQFHAERIRRRGKAVDREREVASADTDVGDRAQPRGRGPLHAERRRRRRGRAPRSPSAGRWPSTRRSSAARTRAACGRRARSAARRAAGAGCRASRPAARQARRRRSPRRPGRRIRSGPRPPPRAPSAKPASSVTDISATRSVHSRWAIWWAMVQPGAGVASAQRAAGSSATSASSSSLSARRSATIGPAVAMPVTLARRLGAPADAGMHRQPDEIDRRPGERRAGRAAVGGNDRRRRRRCATMNDIQNSASCTANTWPRSASSTSICMAVSAHSLTTWPAAPSRNPHSTITGSCSPSRTELDERRQQQRAVGGAVAAPPADGAGRHDGRQKRSGAGGGEEHARRCPGPRRSGCRCAAPSPTPAWC